MAATITTATAPDYDAIVRVVQLYIDACNGDVEKFKEAVTVNSRSCGCLKPCEVHEGGGAGVIDAPRMAARRADHALHHHEPIV